jgi:CheY-like chemotaxis protein
MLGEVISAFEAESVKRNIHVHLEADAFSPWIVRSDPTGLRQVVSNLLANAIQYSDNGPVHVRMEDVGADEVSRTIEISFEDEGCGLSEQNLNNIFQSFERILDDDANSPTAEPLDSALGSEAKPLQIGLGLAFTARFVRLNNGQVKMSSDGEGKGTKVSITIPFRKILQERFAKRELPLKIPLPTPCDDLDMGCLQTDSIPPQFSTFAGPEISLKDVEPDTFKSSNALSPSSEALLTPSNPNLTIGASHPRPSVKPLEHRLAILVAEDNPLNSRLLETRLRKRGHDVTVAVNGQDCFNVFSKRQKTFDAILMDMQVC